MYRTWDREWKVSETIRRRPPAPAVITKPQAVTTSGMIPRRPLPCIWRVRTCDPSAEVAGSRLYSEPASMHFLLATSPLGRPLAPFSRKGPGERKPFPSSLCSRTVNPVKFGLGSGPAALNSWLGRVGAIKQHESLVRHTRKFSKLKNRHGMPPARPRSIDSLAWQVLIDRVRYPQTPGGPAQHRRACRQCGVVGSCTFPGRVTEVNQENSRDQIYTALRGGESLREQFGFRTTHRHTEQASLGINLLIVGCQTRSVFGDRRKGGVRRRKPSRSDIV